MKELSELLTHCIRCGFCLESCPTFVVTGNELESPRGRIYLVRSATEGKLRWHEDVKPHLDLCLGCRACETACPSAVEYGAILELARDKVEQAEPDRAKRALLTITTSPTALRTQLTLGRLLPGHRIPSFVSRLVSHQPAEADRPTPQAAPDWPALDETFVPPIQGEVYLLEGCAMRVLFPRVHQATRRLLRRVGYTVREVEQGCCGSLFAHNGQLEHAHSMLGRLEASMPGDLPVIVNSAGCGSFMKDERDTFAARVKDPSEFLLAKGLLPWLASAPGLMDRVTYHDACHLAHGQKITSDPRQLIKGIPGIDYVELGEADMCCGSAGIYNVTQPRMARNLLERKFSNVMDTGAAIVATGNPGCHSWIAQGAKEHGGRVKVMHTMELLEAAFIGLDNF